MADKYLLSIDTVKTFKIFCFATYFLANLTEIYGMLHGIDDPF